MSNNKGCNIFGDLYVENPLLWFRNIIRARWRYFRNTLTLILLFAWGVPTFQSIISIATEFNYSIAYSLWFILLYLWILERKLNEIYTNSQDILSEKSLADILASYIESRKKYNHADLIIYSGIIESDTIKMLFRQCKNITIYLQNPHYAIHSWRDGSSKGHVIECLAKLHRLSEENPKVNLTIRLYNYRASYKALSLDDSLVVTSWYTYQSFGSVRQQKSDVIDSKQEVIRGSSYPYVVCSAPSKDYDLLKTMLDSYLEYLNHDYDSEVYDLGNYTKQVMTGMERNIAEWFHDHPPPDDEDTIPSQGKFID